MHREKVPWGHSKRWPSVSYIHTNPVDILISDFQPPEQGGNQCLVLKPLSLWSFVMVAQADGTALPLSVHVLIHQYLPPGAVVHIT